MNESNEENGYNYWVMAFTIVLTVVGLTYHEHEQRAARDAEIYAFLQGYYAGCVGTNTNSDTCLKNAEHYTKYNKIVIQKF